MSDGTVDGVVAVVALVAVSVVTRSFFFLSSRPWTLPAWATRAFAWAPIAALGAVIVPEVVLVHGELLQTARDARPYAVAAALLWYWRRRGVLGTMACGMAVYLPLHVGLGW